MLAGLRAPLTMPLPRLYRYRRSGLNNKHMGDRTKSRRTPVFPAWSLGQCLCFTRRGGWYHHFRVMGQVRASPSHSPSTKLTLPLRRTAKVWTNFQLVNDLVGHTQSVWAVLSIEGDGYLTGALLLTFHISVSHIIPLCVRLCRQDNKTLAAT
jgi:hypothetical protein